MTRHLFNVHTSGGKSGGKSRVVGKLRREVRSLFNSNLSLYDAADPVEATRSQTSSSRRPCRSNGKMLTRSQSRQVRGGTGEKPPSGPKRSKRVSSINRQRTPCNAGDISSLAMSQIPSEEGTGGSDTTQNESSNREVCNMELCCTLQSSSLSAFTKSTAPKSVGLGTLTLISRNNDPFSPASRGIFCRFVAFGTDAVTLRGHSLDVFKSPPECTKMTRSAGPWMTVVSFRPIDESCGAEEEASVRVTPCLGESVPGEPFSQSPEIEAKHELAMVVTPDRSAAPRPLTLAPRLEVLLPFSSTTTGKRLPTLCKFMPWKLWGVSFDHDDALAELTTSTTHSQPLSSTAPAFPTRFSEEISDEEMSSFVEGILSAASPSSSSCPCPDVEILEQGLPTLDRMEWGHLQGLWADDLASMVSTDLENAF